MTADELKYTMARIGWGASALARHLGYNFQGIAEWRLGRNRVPEPVAVWLVKVDAWLAKNPPPKRDVR